MIESYVKYYFMLACGFYCFNKLLKLKTSKKQYAMNLILLFFTNILLFVARVNFPYITTVLLFIAIFVHANMTHNIDFKVSILASLLSIGLSYFLFALATILISPLLIFTALKEYDTTYIDPFLMLLTGFVQLIIVYSIFRIKRLQNGMPFLLQQRANTLGLFICCFIVFLTSLFTILNTDTDFYFLITIVSTILGFILFVWWRKQLTISYINRAHKNEILRLEAELEKVKKDNEHLGALIHKDNKLIPAMEMAVKDMLSEQISSSDELLAAKASTLLSDLNKLSTERAGVLNSSGHTRNHLPATGLIRVDSIISYMHEKASAMKANFQVMIDIDINELIKTSISEDSLVTIIADLTENALIAARGCDEKNILLEINKENDKFCLSIFDSGIHFEPYTIINAGKKRASTHTDTGGSGIGLMTTFELLRKCRGSYIIDETIDNPLYTKKVSVLFDMLNEFRIYSLRSEITDLSNEHQDIIINR